MFSAWGMLTFMYNGAPLLFQLPAARYYDGATVVADFNALINAYFVADGEPGAIDWLSFVDNSFEFENKGAHDVTALVIYGPLRYLMGYEVIPVAQVI